MRVLFVGTIGNCNFIAQAEREGHVRLHTPRVGHVEPELVHPLGLRQPAVVDVLGAGVVQPARAGQRRDAAGQQGVQRARVVEVAARCAREVRGVEQASRRIVRRVEAEADRTAPSFQLVMWFEIRVNDPPNLKL